MKKLLPLLVLISSLIFITSCNKSDEKQIIGSWAAKTLKVKSYTDGVLQGEETENMTSNDMTMYFRKDNSYTVYQYGAVTDEGTYSISGDKLTMDGQENTFNVSRKELNLFFSNEEEDNGHTIRHEVELNLEKR